MSNIVKNGFYKLSEIYSEKIQIEDNLVVSIFDDGILLQSSCSEEGIEDVIFPIFKENGLRSEINIEIGENSKVEFYSFLSEKNLYEINFLQKKPNSSLKVRYLLLSKNDEKLKVKIYSKISSSFSKSDVKIISIVLDKGFVDLDGVIEIDKNIFKVEANLLEENLFLGDSGKVKGIPTLLVRSNDVKASHACKIEKISDEKLFYLRSRGIGKENSINMMIESYIKDLFFCISMFDNNFYKKLEERIFREF